MKKNKPKKPPKVRRMLPSPLLKHGTCFLVWKHYNQVEPGEWPWKNFPPREIASQGDGSLTVSSRAMDCLQRLRDFVGRPLVVLSGYRDPAHNKRERGKKRSQHLLGQAFDIACPRARMKSLQQAAKECGFTGFGYYPKRGFLHVDTGPARTWGKKP